MSLRISYLPSTKMQLEYDLYSLLPFIRTKFSNLCSFGSSTIDQVRVVGCQITEISLDFSRDFFALSLMGVSFSKIL